MGIRHTPLSDLYHSCATTFKNYKYIFVNDSGHTIHVISVNLNGNYTRQ